MSQRPIHKESCLRSPLGRMLVCSSMFVLSYSCLIFDVILFFDSQRHDFYIYFGMDLESKMCRRSSYRTGSRSEVGKFEKQRTNE